MGKLREILACAAAKVIHNALRLLRRGGTTFPGRVALKICPDLLSRRGRRMDIIAVTGTNGKTTTSQMLRRMAKEMGISYISNEAGANMAHGIAAVLACMSGKRELGIIECDEGAFPVVIPALRPRVIVVTNFFRDQLDRYGEITTTRSKVIEGIADVPDALLCLNADCSLTATIALQVPNPVRFFGVDADLGSAASAVSDAMRCLGCESEYRYSHRTYAHLGAWYCPGCGRSRPRPDCLVTEVRSLTGLGSDFTLSIDGREINVRLSLPAAYNIYNAAAAVTAAVAMGWDIEKASSALSSVEAPFGRLERFDLDGTPVQVLLAKNPAGMDRVLEYLSSLREEKRVVFCLNDNFADGTDVSWIWDCGFESYNEASPCDTAVYGIRSGDMLLRLKYAGLEPGLVTVCGSMAELKDFIRASGLPCYIAANYTSMLEVREALAAETGKGHF